MKSRLWLIGLSFFWSSAFISSRGWSAAWEVVAPATLKSESAQLSGGTTWKLIYEAYLAPQRGNLVFFRKSLIHETPLEDSSLPLAWAAKVSIARADAMDGKSLPTDPFERERTFFISETSNSRVQRLQYEKSYLGRLGDPSFSSEVFFPEPLIVMYSQNCEFFNERSLAFQGGSLGLTVEVQDPKGLLDLPAMSKLAARELRARAALKNPQVKIFQSEHLLRTTFYEPLTANLGTCLDAAQIRDRIARGLAELSVILNPLLSKTSTTGIHGKLRLAAQNDLISTRSSDEDLPNLNDVEDSREGVGDATAQKRQPKFSSRPEDWDAEDLRQERLVGFRADWSRTHKNWLAKISQLPALTIATKDDFQALEVTQSLIDALSLHFYRTLNATDQLHGKQKLSSPFRAMWRQKLPSHRITKPMLTLTALLNPEIWMGPLSHGMVHAGFFHFTQSWEEAAFLLYLELAHSVLGHGPLKHGEHDATSFLSRDDSPEITFVEESVFMHLADMHEKNEPTNPEFRRGRLGSAFSQAEEREALGLVSLVFRAMDASFERESAQKVGPFLRLLDRLQDFYFTPDLSRDQSSRKFAGRGFFINHPYLRQALMQSFEYYERPPAAPTGERLVADDFRRAFSQVKALLAKHSTQQGAWLMSLLALPREWRAALVHGHAEGAEGLEDAFWTPSDLASKLLRQLMDSFEPPHTDIAKENPPGNPVSITSKQNAVDADQHTESLSLSSVLRRRAESLSLPADEKRIFIGWLIQRLLWRASSVDEFWEADADFDGVSHHAFHDLTKSESLEEQGMLLRTLQVHRDPQFCIQKLNDLMSRSLKEPTLKKDFLEPYFLECLLLAGQLSEALGIASAGAEPPVISIYEYFLLKVVQLRFTPSTPRFRRQLEGVLAKLGERPYVTALRILSLAKEELPMAQMRGKLDILLHQKHPTHFSAMEQGVLEFVKIWARHKCSLISLAQAQSSLKQVQKHWFLARFPQRILPLERNYPSE